MSGGIFAAGGRLTPRSSLAGGRGARKLANAPAMRQSPVREDQTPLHVAAERLKNFRNLAGRSASVLLES
jgi:hypothetical protein